MRGRGRADDHHHVEEAREIPLVSTDYLFLGDEADGKLTVLTVCDSASGMTFASSKSVRGGLFYLRHGVGRLKARFLTSCNPAAGRS